MTRAVETGFYDVVLTAFNSSPLWRDALHSVIPAAVKQNMGVLLASPTQQGWLAARCDDEVENGAVWLNPPRRAQLKALYTFADEIGNDLPVLCLRWALGVPGVSTVLTGPRNVAQLEQNMRAAEAGPLPADQEERLTEIYKLCPYRPFEEPAACRFATAYRGPSWLGGAEGKPVYISR
jgi:aryl-alcohol dehydrogenase-like predicted oxidoreductase